MESGPQTPWLRTGRAGFKYPNKTNENLIFIREGQGQGAGQGERAGRISGSQTGVHYRDHNLITEDEGNNRR